MCAMVNVINDTVVNCVLSPTSVVNAGTVVVMRATNNGGTTTENYVNITYAPTPVVVGVSFSPANVCNRAANGSLVQCNVSPFNAVLYIYGIHFALWLIH
jgi:hypothetical protein